MIALFGYICIHLHLEEFLALIMQIKWNKKAANRIHCLLEFKGTVDFPAEEKPRDIYGHTVNRWILLFYSKITYESWFKELKHLTLTEDKFFLS